MDGQKRKNRSINWSEEEKVLLRQLVKDKIDILENKNTSTNMNSLKKETWKDVLSSFNSLSKTHRDLNQLITQWRNMKNLLKKKDFEYRRAVLITGGGPPPPCPNPEDVAIMEAIPKEFETDHNCFDSDGTYRKEFPDPDHKSDSIMETDVNYNLVEENKVQDVIEEGKARKRKRVSKHFLNKKKSTNENNYEHQLFLMARTARDQKLNQEKELHELKMIHEKELHELKIIHEKELQHLKTEAVKLEIDYWKKNRDVEIVVFFFISLNIIRIFVI